MQSDKRARAPCQEFVCIQLPGYLSGLHLIVDYTSPHLIQPNWLLRCSAKWSVGGRSGVKFKFALMSALEE